MSYEYGNTRLRARRAGLFRAEDYERLAGGSFEALQARLSESPYQRDLEHAARTAQGLEAVQRALRRHLGRSLEELRSFYRGSARDRVDLLLERWEVGTLLVLLRGAAAGAPPQDVLSVATPLGALDEAALRHLCAQPSLRALVDLLVAWRIPLTRSLPAAWPAYDRDGPRALEQALARERADRLRGSLTRGDPEDEPLRRVLLPELDRTNLLAALRLRGARGRGEPLPALEPLHLPGGRLSLELAQRLLEAPTRDEAAALALPALPADWHGPVRAWARDGDLPGLGKGLQEQLLRTALGLFASGDPLGVGVPLAWAWSKEAEARNLGVLARGLARGAPPGIIRRELVVPQ